ATRAECGRGAHGTDAQQVDSTHDEPWLVVAAQRASRAPREERRSAAQLTAALRHTGAGSRFLAAIKSCSPTLRRVVLLRAPAPDGPRGRESRERRFPAWGDP